MKFDPKDMSLMKRFVYDKTSLTVTEFKQLISYWPDYPNNLDNPSRVWVWTEDKRRLVPVVEVTLGIGFCMLLSADHSRKQIGVVDIG